MRRRLSEETQKLVERLHARRPLLSGFFAPEAPTELIRRIGEAGEPEAIPDLLPFVIIGDTESITASADAIRRLLETLRPVDFVTFDEFVRQGWQDWLARREPWYRMSVKDVGHLAKLGQTSTPLLGVATFHRNGHIREEATRYLGKISTGAELPFLLVRVNDWVEEIRSVAKDFVMVRLNSSYIRHFSTWLPLVLRLSHAGRDDHSRVLQAIQELFARPEARVMLEQGFTSSDRFARRFCFAVALRAGHGDLEATLGRAIESRDAEIRRTAVDSLKAVLPKEGFNELLARVRSDSWAPLRREALRIYAEKFPQQAEGEFRAALLDSSVAVREDAQRFFRKMAQFDVSNYYIRSLESAIEIGKLAAAIAGFGETATATDMKLVEPFFSNPSARIRSAALHAAFKLAPDAYIEQFVAALEDPRVSVAREGLRALLRKANVVGGARLWDTYTQSSHWHTKRFVLCLFARLNKWDSIAYLIQSMQETDEQIHELTKRYVARWFARYNRSFARPSGTQLKKLKYVMAECHLLVGTETQGQLESILSTF